MSEQNRTIAQRYSKEPLGGNIELADERVAEDMAFYGPNYWGEAIHGRNGFKGFVSSLRTAFPDLRFELADEVADDSRVATRFTLRDTQRADTAITVSPLFSSRCTVPSSSCIALVRVRITIRESGSPAVRETRTQLLARRQAP